MNATTAATSSRAMILTLGLVATICGILIVSAYQGTLPAITRNRRIAIEHAVFKVIPGATTMKEYIATSGGIAPATGTLPKGGVKFYVAYDKSGAVKGIAAMAAAVGYADLVRVLYAYDPAKQAITGIHVISMSETPGIGTRILTDKAFRANFKDLDVQLAPDMKALAHAVVTVKHGTKTHPWQIDAISGATVTSKAVGRGINNSTQRLLPLLVPHLDKLRKK